MNITSRKDAINAGENTYFTGVPCVNGHTAYRYTKSATCSACIMANRPHTATKDTPPPDENAVAVRAQTLAARNELVLMRFRADFSDANALSEYALALTMARYPLVDPVLLRKPSKPTMTQGSNAMIGVWINPSDRPAVDQMRASLWTKHTMGQEGVQRLREQIFGEAAKLAEKMNTNSGPAGGYGSIPR